MSLAKQFLTALYRFSSYPQLIEIKGIKTFLYTLLTVIFSVVFMLAAAAPGYFVMGGMEGFAKKYIPEFSIKSGVLDMEKVDFEDRTNGVRIYINTEETQLDKSKAAGSTCALIANKNEMYVFNGMQGETLAFKDIGADFGSSDIFKALANKGVRAGIISVIAAMWFVGMALKALYSILMLALIGNIINMFVTRIPVKFEKMLQLSAYARTLPLIMSLVLPLIAGFPFGSLVFYAVGAFYIYMALKNIKAQSGLVIADISGMNN